jgi:hypothetical protein
MANQDIPSTPEGSPASTIVNVVPEQWKKGSCTNIPKVPSGGGEFGVEFGLEFT